MVSKETITKIGLIETVFNILTAIFTFITVIKPLFISYVTGDSIFYLLKLTPTYSYILLILTIIGIVIIKAIKSKMNEGVSVYGVFGGDYVLKWQYDYHGLKWDIEVLSKYYNSPLYEIIRNFDVAETPRCLKCGTKLEFRKHELWYTWNCAECSFKYRTWNSPQKLVNRVENSFERYLEKEIERKYKK